MKSEFLLCALAAAASVAGAETFELKARPTFTPVELNLGDEVRFTLMNGETRSIRYVGGTSAVLEAPATEGLVATFTMNLEVDGAVIPFRRYLATQESLYEPAVVNGLRIFPDSTLDYLTNAVPMRYPSTGPQRHHPWKDCRLCLQDATLTLCPERLHPWFRDARIDGLFVPIGDFYHGGDCWLGPFAYGQAHGGMDICMTKGDLLYAPFALDDQFMPLWANRARGYTSRWRGIRRWPDGTLWSINTSHVIDPLRPEHTAVTNGQPYCTAAGTAVGDYNHTHFELHVHRDLNPPDLDWDRGWGESADVKNDCPSGQPEFYNVDPWMLFWQTFRQLRDERGRLAAEIAPFPPAKAGERVAFRSARALPAGATAVWTFNDGTMHVGAEVAHVFAKPGAYEVTLTLVKGAERARDTAVVTVRGGAATGQLPGVKADDVSFVELKPGDLPAWGEKVNFTPFTVRRENELAFFDRATGGPVAAKPLSKKTVEGLGELRTYGVDGAAETVEVFVKDAPNPGPFRQSAFGLFFQDAAVFRTPCFWVNHEYKHRRRTYVTNGNRRERGQFVRWMPNLRAGKWRVKETFGATHQPGSVYSVTVKDRHGLHRVACEPLGNLEIGVFDFAAGEGWVQIDAWDSKGPVYLSTLDFEPVKLEPLPWMDEAEEKRLREEKAELEKTIRPLFKKQNDLVVDRPWLFRADDWTEAVKAVPSLAGYGSGEWLFIRLTDWWSKRDAVMGAKKDWQTIVEWLAGRCWHTPSYRKWQDEIFPKAAFAPNPPRTAAEQAEHDRVVRAAKRIMEINARLTSGR